MGIIDVHAHFIPQAYIDALNDIGMTPAKIGFAMVAWDADRRLAFMDENGIDFEILSLSSEPGLRFWSKDKAVALVRQLNDALGTIIQASPKRFGGYATPALPYIDAALAEIARGYDELAFDGVILLSNYQGTYIGDPTFAPVMEELNRRKAVVLVHPTESPCSDKLTQGYLAPAFEIAAETTRAAASLIDNDIVTRYPGIRFILSHGGGTIPMVQDRMTRFLPLKRQEDPKAGAKRVDDAIGAFYYDLALVSDPAPLAAIARSHDVSRLLSGYDMPFFPADEMKTGRAHLAAVFSEADREKIASSNAMKLFPRLVR